MSRARASMWCLCLALTGCGKVNPIEATSNGGAQAVGGTGTTTEPTTGAGMAGDAPTKPAETCTADVPAPGASPLLRLESDELNNSVRALLPEAASEPTWLPEDTLPSDVPTALDIEAIHALAHSVALELTSGSASAEWLKGCDPVEQGAETCRDELAEPLLERIYRRPLTDEDREELVDVFASGQKLGGNFESGLRAVIEVALQSPDFLYLIEQGTLPGTQGVVELTGYETAARLAFFLTRSPPDAELLREAERGPMQPSVIEDQTRRLLAKEASQAALSRSLRNLWLPRAAQPRPELGLTPELATAADEASLRFIEDVAFRGAGTLTALLTEPTTWANESLGEYYGYTLKGSGWQKVELDPARASGLFTQPPFLTATSHPIPSAVLRGHHVLTTVLCSPIPPPPQGLLQPLPAVTTGTTGRQRLEEATSGAVCSGCHQEMNAVGFAFEHYDGAGRWRDEDGGLPVDSSGTLGLTEAQGPFADAVELMDHIAGSDAARECFVQQWLQLAYRRELTEADSCAKSELTRRFAEEGGRIDELLVALVQRDNFRYRLASELEP